MPGSLIRLVTVVDALKQAGSVDHKKRLIIHALTSAAFLAAPPTSFAAGVNSRLVASHKAFVASSCEVAQAHLQPCGQPGQGSELSMINLQSLVSQRQQAVQLATDILHNMQCDKCIANIGK